MCRFMDWLIRIGCDEIQPSMPAFHPAYEFCSSKTPFNQAGLMSCLFLGVKALYVASSRMMRTLAFVVAKT